MTITKTERAGAGFAIGRQGESPIIEIRPHHDTISALKGIQVGFELLNGISVEQARKIVDVLNENIVGLLVTSTTNDSRPKTIGAAG